MPHTLMRSLSHLDRDAVLERLGLEPRRSAFEKLFPALATFGAGLVVGAAVASVLAAGGAGKTRRPRGEPKNEPDRSHA